MIDEKIVIEFAEVKTDNAKNFKDIVQKFVNELNHLHEVFDKQESNTEKECELLDYEFGELEFHLQVSSNMIMANMNKEIV